MVEDLINADADINAADNSGKTALHWAAAVNNVDAVNVLLMHGANRDAQDDKVSEEILVQVFQTFVFWYKYISRADHRGRQKLFCHFHVPSLHLHRHHLLFI